jgi:hypothetical protein
MRLAIAAGPSLPNSRLMAPSRSQSTEDRVTWALKGILRLSQRCVNAKAGQQMFNWQLA